MRTKFDLEQKVWYLDIVKDAIVEAVVSGVMCEAEGESYRIKVDKGEVIVPASVLYSARESCRMHYLVLMK